MSKMLSQSPPDHSPTSQSDRRLSVGAKTRTCVHCGRSFRRTEHLERHVRTHTKEKPYTCFCGAAFSRRDLLKRHMGITGHEDINPPHHKSPKSNKTDHETKQRIRRASTARHNRAPSAPEPPQDMLPPSPEESEAAQWSMQQSSNPYMNHDGRLDTPPESDGSHDPEILEAAQLLLPGGLSTYSGAPQSPPTLHSYPPEEPIHYEEFTTFLDSIGLPLDSYNGDHPHSHNSHNHNHSRSYPTPTEIAEPGLHPFFREQERDRSRAGSPYRSWLPADHHHQGYGMVVSDYGSMYHHYHPPEDIARAVVPNF
ncbi:hypothetical protein BJY04DRAFT_198226 [Aspergillus karnatakaensis]|uniref:C2H2-type zinc finger protein n=1 Tax=Aspergillus karnatakaensis TaxID=1810916 RepID=UPI003CCD9B5D